MAEANLNQPSIKMLSPGPISQAIAARIAEAEASIVSPTRKSNTPFVWRRASGVTIEDVDGNLFLDCTSSFGVASVGYGHPHVTAAIKDQSDLLVHTMPGIVPHLPYADALKAIVSVVGRWDHSEVLLTNTGSEAVEVAMKLSLARTGKPGVVAFEGSFHGQSLGALAVTSFNKLRDPFAQILANHVLWAPYPNSYRPTLGATSTSVGDACLEYLERLLKSENTGGPPIGAVLVEPLQNSSGYVLPPKGFLSALRRLCTDYDVLLIADEIFTGFGRTGYWLAADYDQIIPDIVCIGKGMTGGIPSGACIADRSIMSSLQTDEILPLQGSTFAANPLACRAISATIDVLRSENLIERARKLGQGLLEEIVQITHRYSSVAEVRGKGMAIAIEFVKDQRTKERDNVIAWKLMEQLLRRGVVTLVTGLPYGNVLGICPPFVLTDQQADHFIKVLAESLEATMSN